MSHTILLQQTHAFETWRPIAADDDMIMEHNTKLAASFLNLLGHGNIAFRRARIAARMIMRHDDRRRPEFQGSADDFSRIYRCVVNRSYLLHFIGNQEVFTIEKKDAELFFFLMPHGLAAIIQQRLPGA